MSLPMSLDLLVEMIRAYARETQSDPSLIGRDRFYEAHRGRVSYTNEFKQLWVLAKSIAAEDAQSEPPEVAAPAPPATVRDSRIPKLLVIPDAHAHPQYSNERFSWLGALIDEERPDVVVCLGDFADMPALSQYDKGKRGFEGRRYVRDVEATRDALRLMHAGITHGPELIMCLGNHEARISRATSDCAELEGTIETTDLGYEEHGWRVVPYMAAVQVGGFSISHHFASGVAGRPIGGMTMAASMARLLFTSAIVGHSHTLDWARRTRPDGSRIVCLVPGCYTAPEQGEESWCAATAHLWWRGVAILEDVQNGDFGSLRLVSQDSMRERYGHLTQPPAPRTKQPMWKGRAV